MPDLTKVLNVQRGFKHTANSLSDIWMPFLIKPARQTKMVELATGKLETGNIVEEPVGEKPSNQLDIDWKSFNMQ